MNQAMIANIIIGVLLLALYMCAAFIVSLAHGLKHGCRPPTGIKKAFLYPFYVICRTWLCVVKRT